MGTSEPTQTILLQNKAANGRTVDHNEAARSSEEETDSDSSEDDLWVEPAIRQRALTAVDTATGKAGQPVAKVPVLPSTPEETSTAGQAAKSPLSPGPLTVRLDDQARALSPVQMGAVRAPSPVPAAVVANRAERMQDEPINDDGSRDKTYRPGRAIGDLPRRQNPPRNRRPPVRYSDSVFEVNCIFIDMEKKTEDKSATDVTTSEIRQHHGKKPTATTHVGVWPAAIFYVIMFMLFPYFAAGELINSTTNLGAIFGPAQVCGSTGHHGLYIALPDKPRCEFVDPRTKSYRNCLSLHSSR
jgi:hypothetical protein